jgi:hypothetical protein
VDVIPLFVILRGPENPSFVREERLPVAENGFSESKGVRVNYNVRRE